MMGEEVLVIVSHYCVWPERFLLRLVSKKLLRANNLKYWNNNDDVYNELCQYFNNCKFNCSGWSNYMIDRDIYKLGLSVITDYTHYPRHFTLEHLVIIMFGLRMLRYMYYVGLITSIGFKRNKDLIT